MAGAAESCASARSPGVASAVWAGNVEECMLSRGRLISITAAVLTACLSLWAFSHVGASATESEGKREQAAPVTTATVQVESVPVEIRAIGQVEAFTTVDVHAQVSGQLTRVVFHEGDFVKKGDVLFGIDPRSPESDVQAAQANYDKELASERQAEAALARDQVLAKTAAVEVARYQQLFDGGVVSRDQYDQYRTTSDTAAATVKADQDAVAAERQSAEAAKAAVRSSKITLGYTTIVAPMDGRTGSLMAHQGDVVNPTDQAPLVLIAQVTPIYVTFSIPEQQFVRLKRAMPNGPSRSAPRHRRSRTSFRRGR